MLEVLGRGLKLVDGNDNEWELNQLLLADDTVVVADSKRKLCQLVTEFGEVSEKRKLRVNVGKRKVMRCTRNEDNARLNVILNGEALEEDQFKYLGSVIAANGEVEGDVNFTIGSKYSYPPQFWLTQILSGNTEPLPQPSVSHLAFLSHPVVIYCIYLEAVFYEYCTLSINLIKLYLQGNYTFTLLMNSRTVVSLSHPLPHLLSSLSPLLTPSLPLPPPSPFPLLPYSLWVLFQYTDHSHS